mgnify:CR=1 FL=1
MEDQDSKHKKHTNPWVKAGIFGGLGIEFVGFTFVGVIAGTWIDGKFDSSPTGLLICLALSMVAAGLHIYAITKRFLLDD